ncbi:exonuclease SbcC [Alkalispirochaeta americana]|uniref:Exonuclease SbcC n=1 Tax=Alkalispirochaeta americana TaxID=159291 RepID=A0A1N6PVY5_9SPIO|nr:AAA family ATPase [Alkalispirochaeta americana]SIQ08500.1 exonuclease SbcC [Alkalispirochaeta americana]
MRILQIRFKNLNSLVGEWQIDLDHPDFVSDGIFAITGPTGAGKSTILDALCLALYGQTPRLSRISKSGNEIMSRQTGECFAEATFETQSGRFRCHWSQRRARKRSEGDLQPPKHEIARADSGEVLESSLRGVAGQIEAVTGMDFDRFTRSMLLAQGSFAAFLQAPPDERAPLLEQITGTEMYSQISRHVHERYREERIKMEQLQAETAGIVLLEPQEEQELLLKQKEGVDRQARLEAKLVQTEEARNWVTLVKGLKKEISDLSRETGQLQRDRESFQPDRDRLDRARAAASLEGAFAGLVSLRSEQKEDQKALAEGEASLPEAESLAAARAEALELAEQCVVEVRKEQEAAAPRLRSLRSLDYQCSTLEDGVRKKALSCQKHLRVVEDQERELVRLRQGVAVVEADLATIQTSLEENRQDQALLQELAGLEEQMKRLRLLRRDIIQKKEESAKYQAALKRAGADLETSRNERSARQEDLTKVAQTLQQARTGLDELLQGRFLREYRAEKESLQRELLLLRTIADLESHRTRLEDGTPCPLCGSRDHPFAAGNVPVPGETEQAIESLRSLIARAEEQEEKIRELEGAETGLREDLARREQKVARALHDEEMAQEGWAGLNRELERLGRDEQEGVSSLLESLAPLGITEVPRDDLAPLLSSLRKRRDAWQSQILKQEEQERRLSDLRSDLAARDAVLATQRKTLGEEQEHQRSLEEDLARARDERVAKYGSIDPDEEERRLETARDQAEKAERAAREGHDEARRNVQILGTRIDSLRERLSRRAPELEGRTREFLQALGNQGFSREDEFHAARLSPDERDFLAEKARNLDELALELRARQKDREQRLALESARNITEEPLDVLEQRCRDCTASLKDLQETLVNISYRLNEQRAARERQKERQKALDAQRTESRRWADLHELIGSADGKKYRNFAQGLTFEMMIGQANRQLQKMSDRYVLTRREGHPLELWVVDSYQAGEIRSTRNLSGGESFIVSLALALGLSRMASQKVRVDSLFLDEGFGTLDEEALDTALDTLGSLHQEGKLIGIISHVSALKERISTQIRVEPRTGGRSRILGPGCSGTTSP